SFGAAPITFGYFPSGQRASMTDPSGTTTYTYDARDRMLTKVTPFGALTYTYDLAGNVTSIRSSNANGAWVEYTYDQVNRLATVVDRRLAVGADTTVYAYDAVGNLAGF